MHIEVKFKEANCIGWEWRRGLVILSRFQLCRLLRFPSICFWQLAYAASWLSVLSRSRVYIVLGRHIDPRPTLRPTRPSNWRPSTFSVRLDVPVFAFAGCWAKTASPSSNLVGVFLCSSPLHLFPLCCPTLSQKSSDNQCCFSAFPTPDLRPILDLCVFSILLTLPVWNLCKIGSGNRGSVDVEVGWYIVLI